MATTHGGKRAGAGRPKKNRENQDVFPDAKSYLEAVATGRTFPDAVRVAAAKALLPYESEKKRAPVASPSPAKLRVKTQKDIESSVVADFEERAAAIRKKLERG